MSWIRRHRIAVSVVVVPIAIVAGLAVNDSLQRRAFYEKHRLLKEIDEHRIPRGSTNAIILRHVPLGSPRSEAVSILSQEGFNCREWVDSKAGNLVDCGLLQQPASFGTTGRRLIRLSFNNDATLTDAIELPLK